MLNIDFSHKEFSNYEAMYYDVLSNNGPAEDSNNEILTQIKLDVNRTFRSYNLKFLSSHTAKGKNKLYNLLKVYALILDPDIGYTQGMNFIAALILMHVPNQALACRIFTQVLEKDNWARMYISSTPKLFEICQLLTERIEVEIPVLYETLIQHEVVLEAVFASPLMTLFANLLTFSEATHVLNMFILEGEQFIVDLLMNILKNMTMEILKFDSQFEIQQYMSRKMFIQAIN